MKPRNYNFLLFLIVLLAISIFIILEIYQNLLLNPSILQNQNNHKQLKHIKLQRFPRALIIGSPKCGLYLLIR